MAAVGTWRSGQVRVPLRTVDGPPERTETSLEAALQALVDGAVTRPRPHAVVMATANRRFEVRALDHTAAVTTTLLADVDQASAALRAVVFNRGFDLYW